MSELYYNGNRITAVIFDLDGTLRESYPGGDRFMLDEAIRLGISCSEECLTATRQCARLFEKVAIADLIAAQPHAEVTGKDALDESDTPVLNP